MKAYLLDNNNRWLVDPANAVYLLTGETTGESTHFSAFLRLHRVLVVVVPFDAIALMIIIIKIIIIAIKSK